MTPRILSPTIFAVVLLGAGAALADDDDCSSPMSQWQPQEAVVQHAAQLGIEVRRLRIDDGCYEVRGRDNDGNRVELKLDPASLGLVGLEIEFQPGSDPSRYLPGARSVEAVPRQAPTENPLITPGTTPQVNGN
ncbi:MAG: PepSY domain-containing protein [Rhodobacteraceae bacterium CG17_big_fil_post_rev_8_21_14_2_50_65_11]|nr:MAG: PepSY domain-containing protein [Rhodobacteraceae bacterium CG17_big_fil_post_rev_8_21_14_2_50_65_11]